MELIADGLLIATALIAGLYCLVLSRRLRRLTDSGAGIGSQIEALDRALAETRTALGETREGVSELRASARAAIAELKRRTEGAEALATRLAETAARAEQTLGRLYEARDRLEAYERRADGRRDGSEPADARDTTRVGHEAVIVEPAPLGGGQARAQDSVVGESVAGESVAGESVAGESVAGEAADGRAPAGRRGRKAKETT